MISCCFCFCCLFSGNLHSDSAVRKTRAPKVERRPHLGLTSYLHVPLMKVTEIHSLAYTQSGRSVVPIVSSSIGSSCDPSGLGDCGRDLTDLYDGALADDECSNHSTGRHSQPDAPSCTVWRHQDTDQQNCHRTRGGLLVFNRCTDVIRPHSDAPYHVPTNDIDLQTWP